MATPNKHRKNLTFKTLSKLSQFDNCAHELNLLSDHLGQDCHPLSVLKNELASSQKLSESAAKLNKTVETLKGSFLVGKKSYSAQQLIDHWSKSGYELKYGDSNVQRLRDEYVKCIVESEKFSSKISPEFDKQSTGQNRNQDQKGYKHRMSTQMKIVEAMNDLRTRLVPSNLSEADKKLHIKCRKRVLEELNRIYQAQAAVIPNDKSRYGKIYDETTGQHNSSGSSSLKKYAKKNLKVKPCTHVNLSPPSCVTKLDGPNGKKSVRTDTSGLSIDQMKAILDQLQNQGFSVKYEISTGRSRRLNYKIVGPGHQAEFQRLVSDAKAKNESKKTETATLKTENQPKPVKVTRTGSIKSNSIKSKDPRNAGKEALAARQPGASQIQTQRSHGPSLGG